MPDEIDCGNKADSESEEDVSTTFFMEPIVAYLCHLDCNDSVENDGEWTINENVAFANSSCLDDVFNSIHTNSMPTPLPISKMACIQVEDNEGFVFLIPLSKKGQSLIVFSRVQTQTNLSRDSDDNLKPLQFFYYAQSLHRMMKKMR